jgi:L-lactate dehydrogenase complex protein LldG
LDGAFADVVRQIGGRVITSSRASAADALAAVYAGAQIVASTTACISGSLQISESLDVHDLCDLDLFVCEAVLGVAENGAVWVPQSRLVRRVAAFAAEHMAVILEQSAIVPTMHDAYARIDVSGESYGVFIAGPSKTADIEQSLVLGAHGPSSFTVVLVS